MNLLKILKILLKLNKGDLEMYDETKEVLKYYIDILEDGVQVNLKELARYENEIKKMKIKIEESKNLISKYKEDLTKGDV